MYMETTTKKQTLPKGFLSSDKQPTLNAVSMFFVYLKHLPKGWDHKVLNMESVQKVREHFGVTYGFSAMIQWGISHDCSHSKTSNKRHESMSTAYHSACTLLGIVRYTNVTLN
jgi:hypothetical protein